MCQKVPYATRTDALKEAKQQMFERKKLSKQNWSEKSNRKIDVYLCNLCNKYHLTTATRNGQRVMKRFLQVATEPVQRSSSHGLVKCFEKCQTKLLTFCHIELTYQEYMRLGRSNDYKVVYIQEDGKAVIKFNNFPGTWVKGTNGLLDVIAV